MFGQRFLSMRRPTVNMRACQTELIGDGFTSDNAILQEKSHNFMVLREFRADHFHIDCYLIRPSLARSTISQL